jgi:hypothetical protein
MAPNNNIDDLEMPIISGRNVARNNDPSKDDPFKRKKGDKNPHV